MHSPATSHSDVAKRIFRYVKRSLSHGLWYKSCAIFLIEWIYLCKFVTGDSNDRRSTSGYYFGIRSTVISWCNKKQVVVALSTTEAEYIAITMDAQKCIWLKTLIKDMSHKVDYVDQTKYEN